MSKRVRSRILEYLPKHVQSELLRICKSSIISDNNLKVSSMLSVLEKHNIDFIELGPGTNRLAILIDNYVFKIALDKWGMRDNRNEFIVSGELQPFVVKTYETNELISVCEYITVISREEFMDKIDEIREILEELSHSYLLGDVGSVPKNFCNWGYRDDGQLVILDFAYIYRVKGDELLCSNDQEFLEYDNNYHNLVCPSCSRKYSFMDIRRRISIEEEDREYEMAKNFAYELTEPVQEFNERYKEDKTSLYKTTQNPEEEKDMANNNKFRPFSAEEYEDDNDDYLRALEELNGLQQTNPVNELSDEEMEILARSTEERLAGENKETSIIEVHHQTPEGSSHVRVVHQSDIGDSEGGAIQQIIEGAERLVEEVEETTPAVFEEPIGESEYDEQGIQNIVGNTEETEFDRETITEENGVITREHETLQQTDGGFVASREVEVTDGINYMAEKENITSDENMTTVSRDEKLVTTIIHDGSEEQNEVEHYDEDHKEEPQHVQEEQELHAQLKVLPPRKAAEEITVIDQQIHVTDDIVIGNKVTVRSTDEERAAALRQELLGGNDEQSAALDEYDDDDDYEHLYEQNVIDNNRRGGRKSWD